MGWSGFATPLLAQLAGDFREMFPELLCDLPLVHVWAFKYADEVHDGINTHADEAAVNVNVWLTPGENNRDEAGGGLVIFDANVLGSGLSFADYNSMGPKKNGATQLLERTKYANAPPSLSDGGVV